MSRLLLDYAPREPRPWLRRFIRAVVALLILAVGGGAFVVAYRAAVARYWQARVEARLEQLGRYRAPADRVVYDDDRGRMDDLLRQPKYDHFPGNLDHETPRRYAYFDELGPGGVNIGVNRRGHVVLFLHRLRALGGASAVVEIYLDPWDTLGTWDLDAARRVWHLGAGIAAGYGNEDWLTLENVVTYNDALPFAIDDPRPLRIFAGQPHADDPARFTIPYEIGGARGTIEGRFDDDRTVEMRFIQRGAVTLPAR